MSETCPRCGAWLIETNDGGYVCLVARCGWGPSFTTASAGAPERPEVTAEWEAAKQHTDVTLPADVANDIGAELKRLRAQVAAVEALADYLHEGAQLYVQRTPAARMGRLAYLDSARRIRAALEQP